ncbi:TetR family transcriptional regulator [Saccharothrix violaceirubra]|uniref:AcrR family transcriptional regulator n=1 Tax=Saccharothrix violaceirubra TaxID=413306 RepID=A0A7W7WW27_9PSEU|nr:TetR family transcriptional regulator [Saccharothrix violaceirubra]MBB4965671.1 AcrR family transcriptional regulator [Saccharothrix violaceirubra]
MDRRERRKRETRQRIVDTAIRLFAEQGYERTTVVQIAEAADVATKTFFNYFPSKEDVLFDDGGPRIDHMLAIVASRGPDESLPDVLLRAHDELITEYRPGPELAKLFTELVTTVPAIQSRMLRVAFEAQRRMATALVERYPDELDAISAAAVVGAIVGATHAVALTSYELGQSGDEYRESLVRGIGIALRGLTPPRR